MLRTLPVLLLLVALTVASSCAQSPPSDAASSSSAPSGTAPSSAASSAPEPADEVATEFETVAVYDLVGGLDHPWGLAFLPDGRLLVTERAGALRIVGPDGALSGPVAGVPEVVAQRQGGLLDVALAHDFAETGHVYLSYARPGPGGTSATALGRGALRGDRLVGFEVLFTQEPWFANGLHFGGRLAVLPDGHVVLGTGERFQFTPAQSLADHMGVLVRLAPDGSAPPDNPFVGQPDAQPEIWSYGHRNVQSLAVDPATGELWEAEFGPLGGDELNRITPGTNYGWPTVSWGKNYDGSPIPDPPTRPDLTDAVAQWTPVISPSGMTFYTGDAFAGWSGDLFISSLTKQGLVRVRLADGAVAAQEVIPLGARIRDVEQGPDGHLYVATDAGDGHIWRLEPL